MEQKKMIMICMTAGTIVGSYIPNLWGDTSLLSLSSVIFSALGGFSGIWIGYKLGE